MKKRFCLLLLPLLLLGCAQPENLETVSDVHLVPTLPQPQPVWFWLPEGAAVDADLSAEEGTLYLCEEFTAASLTLPGGDLERTLREVTGYALSRLEPISRKDPLGTRWECAWASLGEEGELIARTLILDDGAYHYTLTLQARAEKGAAVAPTWQEIFRTFTLGSREPEK